MTLRLLGVCSALVLLASACIPPESEVDLVRNFDRDTVQGRIQDQGVLRVGIPNVESPWAQGLEGGEPRGFLVDLGRTLAEKLQVDATFLPLNTDEMLELIHGGGLDVAFPLLPITEKAARRNAITDPYFVAHQRLLVPGPWEVEELGGRSLCLLTPEATGVPEALRDPPAAVPPELLNPEIVTIAPPCDEALLSGEAFGATGLDADLIVLRYELNLACARGSEASICGESPGEAMLGVEGPQLSTAGLGAVLEQGSGSWVSYVESVFLDYKQTGAWEASYAQWISPYMGAPPPAPPSITVEEAATLFPRD